MNTEYRLQHNIGKTAIQGINHKLLVPWETQQNLLETQPAEGVCSRKAPGAGPGAAPPLPPTSLLLEDRGDQSDRAQREPCHAAPGGGISKKTLQEMRDAAGEALYHGPPSQGPAAALG